MISKASYIELFLGTILLAWLCYFEGAAYGQTTPPFDFVDSGDITLTIGKEARLQIFNNTTKDLSINFGVFDKGADNPQSLSETIDFAPSQKLRAAEVGVLTLRIKPGASLKSGKYNAYLIMSEPSLSTVRCKEIKLDVPAAPGSQSDQKTEGKLRGLVSEWKTMAYYHPWSKEATLKEPLPLDIGMTAQNISLDSKAVIARLVGKRDGETAFVQFLKSEENLNKYVDLNLILKSNSYIQADEYTGETISIKKETSDTITTTYVPVKLKVVAAHYWYYPLLVIGLGISLYYLMQRYLNVLRRVWVLEQDQLQLEINYENAQVIFQRETEGKVYSQYSIDFDFQKRCAELRAKLKKLKKDNWFSFDDKSPNYQSFIMELSDLQEAVALWRTFAQSNLTPLKQALAAIVVGSDLRPAGPGVPAEPAIKLIAEELLQARPAMTTNDLKSVSRQIEDSLRCASKWPDLNRRAAAAWKAIEEITKAPNFSSRDATEQGQINQDKLRAAVVWQHLWTQDDFDPAAIDETLDGIEANLVTYGAILPAISTAMSRSQSSVLTMRLATLPLSLTSDKRSDARKSIDILAVTGKEPVPPETMLKKIERRMLEWDIFYLAIALGVASFTGIRELYFDKPFGTIRDYATAFVWGFATKAVMDTVTSAIRRFWSAGQR